ncbi:DUF2750 domain-containing protein [Flavobacterium sp. RHBU_24]|uniref:DUF2750 domain-containing protein n=1 Tax=Flavobacterium sp. RHBU_24 TaxID=3391185 RepID=UPI00398521F1
MEQHSEFHEQYDHFIKTISASQQVYALQSSQGYATSRTNEYEDEEGESLELICFWSDKALADACAVNAWKGYKPVAIPLGEFMESWCVGMYQEDVIAGIDFDAALTGYEAEPLVLVNRLIAELTEIESLISFVNYTGLTDFSTCLKEALA